MACGSQYKKISALLRKEGFACPKEDLLESDAEGRFEFFGRKPQCSSGPPGVKYQVWHILSDSSRLVFFFTHNAPFFVSSLTINKPQICFYALQQRKYSCLFLGSNVV